MIRRGGESFIVLCLFSLSLWAAPAVAADNPFSRDYLAGFITMEDGLPGNFVDEVFMDSSGFIWVGTSGSGLCRYDGYGFLPFSTNTAVGIRNNFIRYLAEDRWRRLWIASEGGVDVLDLDSYTMSDLGGTALAPYLDSLCSFLTVDAAGCVWLKSGITLLRVSFDGKGNIASVETFEDERLSPQTVVFKDVEGDGSVWIGLAGRVRKIVPSADGLKEVPVLEGFTYRADAYLSDFLMREDEVWVSTNDGLFRCSLDGSRWKHYTYDPADPRSLSQNFITGLAVSPGKRVIAASLKGFNIYDPIGDDFVRVASGARAKRAAACPTGTRSGSERRVPAWYISTRAVCRSGTSCTIPGIPARSRRTQSIPSMKMRKAVSGWATSRADSALPDPEWTVSAI